jgi:hypothetical protein
MSSDFVFNNDNIKVEIGQLKSILEGFKQEFVFKDIDISDLKGQISIIKTLFRGLANRPDMDSTLKTHIEKWSNAKP